MAVRKRRGRESKKMRGRVDRNERKSQIGAAPGSSSECGGCVFDKKKTKKKTFLCTHPKGPRWTDAFEIRLSDIKQ